MTIAVDLGRKATKTNQNQFDMTVQLQIAVKDRLDLTHISLASVLWDIGKLCKNRSDAAEIIRCSTIDFRNILLKVE